MPLQMRNSETTQTNLSMSDSPLLHGIIPPIVTPLLEPDRLDVAGLERLIEHLVSGGVHGLFVLGTTGEGPSLSARLKREMVEHACKFVRGRLPVLVGITDPAYFEALDLAGHAAKAGAHSVVCAPPFYFPADQNELLRYFRQMTAALPVPLVLYNMPGMTKTVIEPATVRALMQEARILGIKDSSGDESNLEHLAALAKERPDWRLFVGPDELMERAVHLGGHGGVNGAANVRPRLLVDIYEAAIRKDEGRLRLLRSQLEQLTRIYTIGRSAGRFVTGIKSALAHLGVCSDCPAEPFQRLSPLDHARVGRLLSEAAAA
jgi:dihydrodipicolinate synthase/N-acetylneuraminate lyase